MRKNIMKYLQFMRFLLDEAKWLMRMWIFFSFLFFFKNSIFISFFSTLIINLRNENDEMPEFIDGSPIHLHVYEKLATNFPVNWYVNIFDKITVFYLITDLSSFFQLNSWIKHKRFLLVSAPDRTTVSRSELSCRRREFDSLHFSWWFALIGTHLWIRFHLRKLIMQIF